MGKQGPCYHCGVTSTPLWRNGPPEKPVLCNACGSRWRTKGSLVNYTPLHSRADGEENKDHQRYQRMKSISVNNKYKETKTLKRKAIQEPVLEFNYGFKKAVVEEDASNRSSSGSAISNSESCAQFSSADGSELTGPSQSNAWDTTVPCKRRTCMGLRPKTSSVEKLTQDLYNILQEQQSSVSSGEEDLLFENEMLSMVSVEIGHGSVLMRNPHSFAREEVSEEASCLSSVENKSSISDAYSSHSVKRAEIGAERGSVSVGQAVKEEQLKRLMTKSQNGRVHVLGSHGSPLCSIDLKDVFNFDEFIEQFTEEEQKKLMRLLPQIDSVNLPDSLRMMFESAQFKENFSLFQKLIADGVFEMPSSTSEERLEEMRTFKKLALSDFRKSRLVESYNLLKEGDKGSATTSRSSNPNVHKNIVTIKRRCENQTQLKSESRGLMRSPKSVTKMKASHEGNGSCFRPRSLASVFAQGNCSSDQDLLLLDLPSNGSFPQAELLHQL
ncbi:hypothetical protein BRARA_A00889 [Brassica rapa]|uniref:Uncharacterized protein n=2 Tax=Brassica campestris TaxID=3711 RepID=A0A398AQX8_BRACM|nr:hypothetical protein BRARA_A00889 [Brassica rapa]